ncbi:hypothetical protein A3E39_00740 [Candidatus Uhrbacteria bacterium RIFCSPHIGHO2_12_FULL_60_25]|uniref:Uncharacterized protein n=1 Tax=Candidatus Uhrbacteria bacterium RIFCSPHIGHO2_12_FULL_60_25 TaxID=1802399 RepID=A0A1F7UN21_9BACT|nr:MAG: hypothetical protein A3D73_00110 [Candidatus Uhrbacteria bacterium RIFCSPHIGHO2_02_FULL_60_44]OGL79635.1 MAG: hypothetical protein A3E39_00740 [Candidatus Uhrbacteria bacterium RIFCSPHIGHO2_12_FULL_60_25]
MHSVVDMVPMGDADPKLSKALRVVEDHAMTALGREIGDLATLKRLSTSPRAEISHLRDLGRQLKFVTIPFSYLDPASYADEPAETRWEIATFVHVLSPMFDVYAMCPLEYYSLARHIAAVEDLPIMVPEEYVQIFQMLDMCLPVFRGIRQDIAELREKLELNIRAQQERARIRMLDPMMFAVPKTKGIQDDGLALIGPAWGPDLDDLLLRNFELKAKPEQRRLIEESVRAMLGDGERAFDQTDVGRLNVDPILLNEVTRDHREIREDVRRYLEGDGSVLNAPPINGHAYTLTDITRVGQIARRSLVYLQRLHRD